MHTLMKLNKENLRNFTGGDEAIMYDFLKLVVDDLPKMINEIKMALEKNDISAAIGMVHTIKPQLHYIVLDTTFNRAVHLMDISKKGLETDQCPTIIQSIIADCESSYSEMQKFLSELHP